MCPSSSQRWMERSLINGENSRVFSRDRTNTNPFARGRWSTSVFDGLFIGSAVEILQWRETVSCCWFGLWLHLLRFGYISHLRTVSHFSTVEWVLVEFSSTFPTHSAFLSAFQRENATSSRRCSAVPYFPTVRHRRDSTRSVPRANQPDCECALVDALFLVGISGAIRADSWKLHTLSGGILHGDTRCHCFRVPNQLQSGKLISCRGMSAPGISKNGKQTLWMMIIVGNSAAM